MTVTDRNDHYESVFDVLIDNFKLFAIERTYRPLARWSAIANQIEWRVIDLAI